MVSLTWATAAAAAQTLLCIEGSPREVVKDVNSDLVNLEWGTGFCLPASFPGAMSHGKHSEQQSLIKQLLNILFFPLFKKIFMPEMI